MRLTSALWKFKFPRGHIHQGKFRLVRDVSKKAVDDLRLAIQQEEENMFILRHPYLTKEQSCGHAKPFNKHAKWLQYWRDERHTKFSKHRTFADTMAHLKIKEYWDL